MSPLVPALIALLAAGATAQELRWKGGGSRDGATSRAERRWSPERRRLVLEFAAVPDAQVWSEIQAKGMRPLSYIPDRAVMVSLEDASPVRLRGLVRAFPLPPARKWSREAEFAGDSEQRRVVEFHPDVSASEARGIVLQAGLRIHDHPDLRPGHLLVSGDVGALRGLTAWDEVAYVFPASRALERGEPAHACAGALAGGGPVAQYVASVGPGWDGYGLGPATLSYSYEKLSARLPEELVRAEIDRAMAEWAKHVRVDFVAGGSPHFRQNINYRFAKGNHGCFYPFDGPGRVLAHTFYPAPPNPEPIAGDVHFDDDEAWDIGVRVDVFSVALHELGHALGLAHSDSPKDVMYPYYQTASELSPGDIASIQQLYASKGPEAPVEPLELEVTSPVPGARVSEPWLRLSGRAAGGVPPLRISWSTALGVSGSLPVSGDWMTPPVLLRYGPNVLTITLADSRGAQLSRQVTVERVPEEPAPPPEPPPSPEPAPPPSPTPSDRTPPAIRVLYPASTTMLTRHTSIIVRGTAVDSAGVSRVEWSTNAGFGGVAKGTGFWEAGPIPLILGSNVVTLRAYDGADNESRTALVVVRQ